jgi:pimeloyl-[acyl-carrier protein] methyl ester esterase
MTTYHDQATGPAVVVLPGLAATAATVGPIIEELAAGHHVITAELPGHGTCRRTTEPPGLAAAVRHLDQVVTALEARPLVLVGWSLGATVAYHYLRQYGDAGVLGLVSVEQSPCLLAGPAWPHAAFGTLDQAGATRFGETITADYGAFADTLIHSSFAAGTEPAAPVVQALVREAHRCDPVAVRALFDDVVADDCRATAAGIAVPTLLVHGARSQVYPSDVGRWLHRNMPDARLERFPCSGHLPFVEERARFGRVVRDFVTAVAAVRGPSHSGGSYV